MGNDLDLRGQVCPLTVIKLTRHMKKLPADTTFIVRADDSQARVDFPAVVATTKNEFIGVEEFPEYQEYTIRKK
jgi:TusA-related sulfurtransferase